MKTATYILIFLIVISVLTVDIHFSSSYKEYSRYNSNWNGTSLFINDALTSDAVLIKNYDELTGVKNSTLIIIEPEDTFSPDDLHAIRDYKNNGNLIFISDETGSSITLLKLFGVPLTVENVDLLSVDFEYDSPGFIICYISAEDPLLTGVISIALNKPSVAKGENVLIQTSFLSWVDENKNGEADPEEPLGKRAVLVKSKKIYLLSDSGIFQNSAYKDKNLKDNKKFIQNLLKSSESVYIEDKHSKIESEEEILKWINIIRDNKIVKAVTIIIIILILLLIYRGKYDRFRT